MRRMRAYMRRHTVAARKHVRVCYNATAAGCWIRKFYGTHAGIPGVYFCEGRTVRVALFCEVS